VDENLEPPPCTVLPPTLSYATPPRRPQTNNVFADIAWFVCAAIFGVFGIFAVCLGWAGLMDMILHDNAPTDRQSVESVVLIILIGAFSTFMSIRWFRARRKQLRL